MNETIQPAGGSPKPEPPDNNLLGEIAEEIENGTATIDDLLVAARSRLLRLITIRMANQLRRRVDPEDVLQETFIAANKRFEEYLSDKRVPVFVWLRGLAIERMIEANRFHLGAAKRNLNREQAAKQWIDQSTVDLLQNAMANQKSPSSDAANRQRSSDLWSALQKLPERYRDILVLRFFESLTVSEAAVAMNTSVANAKVLQFRALKKLEGIILGEFNWKSADREQ